MIDDKLITQFIPANMLENSLNVSPGASFYDKANIAMRRYLTSNSFTGEITENTPKLIVLKGYFDPQRMGYDVIARIL